MKRKLLSLLMAFLFTVPLCGCAAGDIDLPFEAVKAGEVTGTFDGADGYVLCGEDGGLKLYVDPVTTWFYVENTADGSVWHSSPVNGESDPDADGVYRMEMLSNLVVTYANSDTHVSSRANVYTGSVLDGDFVIRKIDGGFRVDYHLAEVVAAIPLCVYLDDGALNAEILAAEITVENAKHHITDIALLPFFGAGGPDLTVFGEDDVDEDTVTLTYDEGYLFIADGSGALIRFNNGKSNGSTYDRPVYGREPTTVLNRYDLDLDGRNITMPVFGIRRNGSAVLAVLENGAAIADIQALVNGQQTSFANVYARFAYHETLSYELGGIKAPVYEKGETQNPSLSVRYLFLSGDEADYNGMARAYRAYLMGKYALQETNSLQPAIYLELYGGVSKTVSRLGIQYETILPLTTTEQVRELVDLLKAQGVANPVICYRNWNVDDLAKKSVNSAAVADVLNKTNTTLADLLVAGDLTLYPALYDLTTFENGGFVQRTFETATDISGVSVRAKRYAPGIGTALEDNYYFVTALGLPNVLLAARNALCGKNITALALSDVGNTLYNDYRDGNVRRSNVQLLLQQSLAAYAEQFDLLLNCPNDYAISFADELIAVPTASSGHDLFDQDVPFYSMVVSGLKRYAAAPLNNSAMGDDAFLKVLETGSMISYTWIFEEADVVKNTDLSFLSGSNYQTHIDKAVQQYKITAQIAAKAGNGEIHSHRRIDDDVYCLTYETGLNVYVNYSDRDFTLPDGTAVPARGWLLTEGGEGYGA